MAYSWSSTDVNPGDLLNYSNLHCSYEDVNRFQGYEDIVVQCSKNFLSYMDRINALKLARLICETLLDGKGRLVEDKYPFAKDRCMFVAYLLKAGVPLHLEKTYLEEIFGMSDYAANITTDNDDYDDDPDDDYYDDDRYTPVKFMNIDDWPLVFWNARKNASVLDTEAFIIDMPKYNNEEHNFIVIPGNEYSDDAMIRDIIGDTLGVDAVGNWYHIIGTLRVEGKFVHGRLTKKGLKISEETDE